MAAPRGRRSPGAAVLAPVHTRRSLNSGNDACNSPGQGQGSTNSPVLGGTRGHRAASRGWSPRQLGTLAEGSPKVIVRSSQSATGSAADAAAGISTPPSASPAPTTPLKREEDRAGRGNPMAPRSGAGASGGGGVSPSPTTKKRLDPGTSTQHFYDWPAEKVASMRGAFAIQQYLQQLIRDDPSNTKLICTPPSGQDLAVWKFEQLRRFTLELNFLVVALRDDCTKDSCPVMKATDEWQYLCAAHKTPKECCAIDYMVHTLDGTACLLNNNRIFPSRVSIPKTSLPYFQSIARRLYRIFSHAWFHHSFAFCAFEGERYLCERFTIFCRTCKLIPEEHLMVPPDAMSGYTRREIRPLLTGKPDRAAAEPHGSASRGPPPGRSGRSGGGAGAGSHDGAPSAAASDGGKHGSGGATPTSSSVADGFSWGRVRSPVGTSERRATTGARSHPLPS